MPLELSPRLTRLARTTRLALLRRRRPLAALCVGVAVLSGLAAVRPPTSATSEVLVAARDLPAGATLTGDDLREAAWPVGGTPSGAVREADGLGRVLAAPLRAGEPVTDVRLVGPSLAAGTPGLVALPVRFPDAGAVGLLHPGDRIDLVGADPQGGAARPLAQAVPVLAIPPADGVGGIDGSSGRLVVLGVAETEVSDLTEAAVTSELTWTWSAH